MVETETTDEDVQVDEPVTPLLIEILTEIQDHYPADCPEDP